MRAFRILLLLVGAQALPSLDTIHMGRLQDTLQRCVSNSQLGSDLKSAYESCHGDIACIMSTLNWIDESGEPLLDNIMASMNTLPERNPEEAASCRVLEALMGKGSHKKKDA